MLSRCVRSLPLLFCLPQSISLYDSFNPFLSTLPCSLPLSLSLILFSILVIIFLLHKNRIFVNFFFGLSLSFFSHYVFFFKHIELFFLFFYLQLLFQSLFVHFQPFSISSFFSFYAIVILLFCICPSL